MRYDSARLADFSAVAEKERRRGVDTSFFVHFYFSAGFNLKNSVFSALFAPFYLIPAFSIVLNLFCISLVNLHIAYIVIT